jgi:hypothetical protein
MTKEANFELLLQDARKEAAKNALTEEILTQLLDEENQLVNQIQPDLPSKLTEVPAKNISSEPA